MNAFDRRDLEVALRYNLPSFIQRSFQTVVPAAEYLDNWHIDAMAWHLQQCLDGRIKRLIITVPPRNLKSICASVAFPAWVLGRDPTRRIICASYANDLTAKHARDCRAVMESPWYRSLFPRTRLNPKKCAELEFETTRQGYRYGTSTGGALTGRGGNFLIIDDPIKPADAMSVLRREFVKQWFDITVYSRLDSKKDDVIIILMQRVHVDDLVGHILEKDAGWVHLDLPAIADAPQAVPIGPNEVYHRQIGEVLHPEREPMEVLDQIKAEMGSAAFSAQYQQRPVPVEGNLVKWTWFRFYAYSPAHDHDGRVIQSWDTASKAGELNDYSVCTTWLMKGDDYYLLDVLRERLEYPSLKKRVIEMARRHAAHSVLIEDKGSGTQLIQDLRHEKTGVRPIAIMPEADKVTRMSNQSAHIEAGQVILPESAPWLDEFKVELMAFPNGRFDDQVDSLSQFLGWAEHNKRFRVRSGRHIGMY
ncbi:MAG: phage terminase large subunit [Proteobacteria bacterium]|nr:phage terminase large subunit [Pseudomonadota bacterium]